MFANPTAVIIVLLPFLGLSQAENIKGVLPLNSGTFDKVVGKYTGVLVKFDKPYPYGDKQNAFKALAEASISQNELIIGDVTIYDYGHRENSELQERFDVSKEDFPKYKLFVKGRHQEPIDFTGDESNVDDLKRFIVKETGLWLGLPACIEEYDKLVKGFFTAPSLADRHSVVRKAKERAEAVTEESTKSRALYYAKTLEKLLEKGDEYLASETERIEKLLEGKVSEGKKSQLRERASILTSFKLQQKDEL